jgi:hypothetical protein
VRPLLDLSQSDRRHCAGVTDRDQVEDGLPPGSLKGAIIRVASQFGEGWEDRRSSAAGGFRLSPAVLLAWRASGHSSDSAALASSARASKVAAAVGAAQKPLSAEVRELVLGLARE